MGLTACPLMFPTTGQSRPCDSKPAKMSLMQYPIRPNILRMRPYPPGKPIEDVQRELGLTDVVKLASNENPIGPSRKAIEALMASASDVSVYPDARSLRLRTKLAERHGISIDQVMVGNGSDEIIAVLGQMFLEPGTELVMGHPSFLRYDAAAHVSDSKLVKVPLTADWKHDLPAMARAVNEKTRLVFIANPNNPTGTIVDGDELAQFLDGLADHVLVVLDEAYFEYAQGTDYPNCVELLQRGRRIVVMRTFSKAFGLAGLRIGYAFADPAVVQAYDSARAPFDVNLPAQFAAMAALDDYDHLERTLQVNREGMDYLLSEMTGMGLATIPSRANFVCIRVDRDDNAVFSDLLRQGVIVRPGSVLGLPGYIRVSIGTMPQNQQFVEALKMTVSVGATA